MKGRIKPPFFYVYKIEIAIFKLEFPQVCSHKKVHSSLDLTANEFFYDESFKDYIRIGAYYYKDNSFDNINSLFEFMSVLNSTYSSGKKEPDLSSENFIHYSSSEILSIIPNLSYLYEFSQCNLALTQSPVLMRNYFDKETQKINNDTIPLEVYEISIKDMAHLYERIFRFKGTFYLHSVQFCEEMVLGDVILRMRIRGYEETNSFMKHEETNS